MATYDIVKFVMLDTSQNMFRRLKNVLVSCIYLNRYSMRKKLILKRPRAIIMNVLFFW
jgi:hypothetical protein